MRLPRKDLAATGLVAVAVVFYLLWVAEATLPGMSAIRATGLAILVLGMLASMSAVVPTFDQLMHGNKLYLVVTSTIGAVAAAGGAWLLVDSNRTALDVMIAAMVALWLIATIHHGMLATHDETSSREVSTESRQEQLR